MKSSIRSVLLATVAGAAVLSAAGDALALEIAGATVNPEGSLVLRFRHKVVPPSRSIRYALTSRMTAVFVCASEAGDRVLPGSRATISRDVLEVKLVQSSAAGDVEETIATPPPEAPSLDCPPRMAPQIASVSYDVIRIVSRHGSTVPAHIAWDPIPLP